MKNVKILDCTLRDGGYVNNWNFGKKSIFEIIKNLQDAKIDYIECGFLKSENFDEDKSLFSDVNKINSYLTSNESKLALMINFGDIDIKNIPNCQNNKISLRVAFKYHQKQEALIFCQELKNKGYEIFINPMHTNIYSDIELIELIEKVNKISPKSFTIVDTIGVMEKENVLHLYHLINNNLNKDIALCFHFHNNKQLSFSNAQILIEICKERELIIDSTLFGMGRGAGNLCSELLIKHLNDNFGANYNLNPILKAIEEKIKPIFKKTPWGYCIPYYLSAINHCHPNYAKFLIDKQIHSTQNINIILNSIPNDKKANYDVKIIEEIFKQTLKG